MHRPRRPAAVTSDAGEEDRSVGDSGARRALHDWPPLRVRRPVMEHGRFSFEGLDAYRVAAEALRLAIGKREVLRGMPGELRNQLERALVSVVANIAESSGRDGVGGRRRHLAIARGSSNEAGSLVEIAHMIGAL